MGVLLRYFIIGKQELCTICFVHSYIINQNFKIMTKLVVSNHNLFVYRLCDEIRTSLCIEKWEEELKQEVDSYSEKAKADSDNAAFWQKQSLPAAKYLESGFSVYSHDEYDTKVREYFLSQPVIEIPRYEFYRALNVLPPRNWFCCDEFEMFHISEADYSVYHTQYYHNKKTDKFYTCISDVYDKSTWIDKRI